MTDQNELSDRLMSLLRKISQDSLTITRDNPDYLFYVDLERMGFAGRTVYVHTKPCLTSEFFITSTGWDYLTEHKPSVQPDQTRMEQFTEDYSEISEFLRNICTINQALGIRYSALTDLVNDITSESQVRQDLCVAIETIADYLPRCQKQVSRFNPAQIEILDAFLGGLLFEAELDGVTEDDSDFAYAEFGRRVVVTAKHYQAMANAAQEDKVGS